MTNSACTPLNLWTKGSNELQLQWPEPLFGLQETVLVYSHHRSLWLE